MGVVNYYYMDGEIIGDSHAGDYMRDTLGRVAALKLLFCLVHVLVCCMGCGPGQALGDQKAIVTPERILSKLKELPHPLSCQGLQGSEDRLRKERDLITGLEEISVADSAILYRVYEYENSVHGTAKQSDCLRVQLLLLTRLLYQVEVLKERKQFGSELDDGSRPSDWLWPLYLDEGQFKLSSNGLGSHTGLFRSAYSEYIYVKAKVPKRK